MRAVICSEAHDGFVGQVAITFGVAVPAARAVLYRQVQSACDARGLGGEYSRQQDCEQALFHVILSGLRRAFAGFALKRARRLMIIVVHSQ